MFLSNIFAVLLLIQPTLACMETAWKHGGIPDMTKRINYHWIPTGNVNTCSCCGLCYQYNNCSSFSYHKDGHCVFYDTVANYSTLYPDPDWLYFVKPGKSGHNQFCRQDSDCTEEEDSCRGRVCTTLSEITCQTIKENFNPLTNFQTLWQTRKAYGWLGGRPVGLICLSGFTRIFQMRRGHGFTNTTLWDFNSELELDDDHNHSILNLTDTMLKGRKNYRLYFYVPGKGSVNFLMQRDSPVIGFVPRHRTYYSYAEKKPLEMSLPYLVRDRNVLLSVQLDGVTDGAIATKDGNLGSWFDGFNKITMYLKEQ